MRFPVAMPPDAHDFGVLRVAGDQHHRAFIRLFRHDFVDLGDKRAGRVAYLKPQRPRLLDHRLAHAVGADDQRRARGHLRRAVHDLHPARDKRRHGLRIVDERAECVHGLARVQQFRHHLHRFAHAEAKARRLSQIDSHLRSSISPSIVAISVRVPARRLGFSPVSDSACGVSTLPNTTVVRRNSLTF